MKREFALIVLCIVAVCVVMTFAAPQTANADMGPKPSIRITFTNMGDELCYGTILSKSISTGPHSAYAPEEGWDYKALGRYDSNYYYDENYHNEEVERIWQTFVDYEDVDGFYFLQLWWELDGENNQMNWTYHPPYTFKILLYYPESNTFVTSEIYERYAFDSYYTVNMKNVDIGDGGIQLVPTNSYDYFGEIVGLICRIALTVLIELLIALLFRIKGRKPMLTILIVNLSTQIALNVALNVINYLNGALAYLFAFVLLEIAVVIVEAVAYCIILRKQGVPIWKSLVYAVVANAVTAVAGYYLAIWLPGMF